MQEPKNNPFKAYLLRKKMSVYVFAKLSGINVTTLYAIARGKRAYQKTAIRICETSKGELTLEDFGYTCRYIIAKQDGELLVERESTQEVAGKPISQDGCNTKKNSEFIPIGHMSRKLSGSKESKEDV